MRSARADGCGVPSSWVAVRTCQATPVGESPKGVPAASMHVDARCRSRSRRVVVGAVRAFADRGAGVPLRGLLPLQPRPAGPPRRDDAPTRRSRSTGGPRSSTPPRPRSASRSRVSCADMGRLDEAAEEARAAVALDADDADAHLILAQLEQVQAAGPAAEEALRRAAAQYEDVARLRPTDGESLLNLAGIYGQLQQHEDAARVWEMYLALDPGNFEAHVQRGTHLLLAGRVGGGRGRPARRRSSCSPTRPGRTRSSATSTPAPSRPTRRSSTTARPSRSSPANVRMRLALGEVLHGAKRPQEALAEAEAVLAADPANRFALDLKGRSLRDLRRFDEAAAAADALIAADPKDPKAAYLKVTIAEARRDFAAAATLLEEILSRPPAAGDDDGPGNRRVFLVHLGFAYQQLERYAEAAKAFARAMAKAATRRRQPPELPRRGALPREAEGRGARGGPRGPRALPRRRGPLRARGHDPAREGRHGRRHRASSRRCARRRPTDRRRCSAAWPTSTGGPAGSRRRRRPCARRSPPTRRASPRSSSSGRCSSARSATTTPRRSSARPSPSSPTPPPCSTTSAT